MAPSPLHGLNIVQAETASAEHYSDAQDPLLANAPFPDLAAQLDLWSNLTFQTDEPPLARKNGGDPKTPLVGDDLKDEDGEVEGPASLEGHVNAVNPTAVSNPARSQQQRQQAPAGISQQQSQHPQYDVGSFLAGFGIDPFLVPQVQTVPTPPQAATLAQLLAAYPFPNAPFFPQIPSAVAPTALSATQQQQQKQSTPASTSETSTGAPPKRGRNTTRKSISSISESNNDDSPDTPTSANGDDNNGPALSPQEDKRRRNTAASARFRLKKKEREAALERRATELESRVTTLERECEGLRRENGWLKGLVVGVTGASQGASVVQQPPHQQQNQNQSQQGSGVKRKRTVEEGKKDAAKKLVSA